MKKSIMLYIMLFVIITLSNSCAHGTGSIKGRVVEADNNQPLPFANVIIVGTSSGSATDVDGYFQIRNIQNGSRQLEFSYIVYVKKIIDVNIVVGVLPISGPIYI